MLSTILARLLNLANQKQAINLSDVEGKSIGIDITESPQSIALLVRDNQFHTIEFSEVDVTLSGNLRAFLAMIKDAEALDSDDLMISGKLQAAKRYQQVFSQLGVDWEKFFTNFIPKDVAERGVEHLRDGMAFAKQVGDDLFVGLVDYLSSDKALFVQQTEYQIFADRLQSTLSRVDKLLNDLAQKP